MTRPDSAGRPPHAGPAVVAYVIAALVSGGAERQLLLLLEHLDRSRFEPHVIAFADGRWRGRFARLGAPVSVSVVAPPRGMRVAATASALASLKPDLVHTIGHSANYAGRLSALLAGIPTIISERSAPDRVKTRAMILLDRFAEHSTSHVITNSQSAARFYRDRLCYPEAKVSVILNGIEEREPAITETPELPPVVATVTDFRSLKNHHALLDATRRIVDAHPECTVRVVGDGDGRAEAEGAFTRAGLRRSVVFEGYRDDVDAVLARADVYVHTSRYEGLPNSLLEAMALGKPCIAFDVPGCNEVVCNGTTGYLVPDGDTAALARRVGTLLDDPDRRAAMGAASRERVRSYFRVDSMVDRTCAVYDAVIEARTQPGRRARRALTTGPMKYAAATLARPRACADNRNDPPEAVARASYSVWFRHVVTARALGAAPELGTVVEIGPGGSRGVGYCALAAGAGSVLSCDIAPLVVEGREPEVVDAVIALFGKRAAIPDDTEFSDMHPRLADYSYPADHIAARAPGVDSAGNGPDELRRRVGEGVRYVAPVPVERLDSVAGRGVADYVMSQAVMEYAEDLDAAYRAIHAVLRDGGITTHQIDLGAHQTSDAWDGHWSYPPLTWKAVRGFRRPWLNRLPASAHLSAIARAGLEIVGCCRVDAEPSAQLRLHDESSFSPEDRRTRSLFVVARKPIDTGEDPQRHSPGDR